MLGIRSFQKSIQQKLLTQLGILINIYKCKKNVDFAKSNIAMLQFKIKGTLLDNMILNRVPYQE